MHRRAVTCNMCGKAFFEASLKIHQPQCLKKQQMMHIPCSYCNCEFRRVEMPDHLKKCSAARKHRKQAAAAAARREEKQQRNVQHHQRSHSDGFNSGGGGAGNFGSGGGGGGVGRGANRRVGGAAPRRQQQHPRVGSSPQRGSPGQRRPQQQRLQEVSAGGGSGGNDPKNKTNWRKQRAQLKEAMQAARQMTRFEKGYTDVMPEVKPSAPDPSLVACPHCGRTFSESAAERHIPICKNLIHTRPKPVTKSPTRNYTDTASNFTGKTNLDNANKWGGTQTARASRGGHGGIAKGNHTSAHNPILGNR